MNLQDRFDVACNHAGTTQIGIARILGVHKSTIGQFRRGKKTLGDGFTRIAKILNVSPEWLEHGSGPTPDWLFVSLEPSNEPSLPSNLAATIKKLADNQEAILQAIQNLTEAVKRLEK